MMSSVAPGFQLGSYKEGKGPDLTGCCILFALFKNV